MWQATGMVAAAGMIAAVHLLWIIPLSAIVGFFIAALMAANDRR